VLPVRPVGTTGQTGPAHRSDRSKQISSGAFRYFLGATGQTGRQDRSDRSARLWTDTTGQTGPVHRSDRSRQRSLLFSRFASDFLFGFCSLVLGLLCWFSFYIAIPNFGQNACGFG